MTQDKLATRNCGTCGRFMSLPDEDCNGEVESEYQCNNQDCPSNNNF